MHLSYINYKAEYICDRWNTGGWGQPGGVPGVSHGYQTISVGYGVMFRSTPPPSPPLAPSNLGALSLHGKQADLLSPANHTETFSMTYLIEGAS